MGAPNAYHSCRARSCDGAPSNRDMIDAQRAYEIGLANMICPPAALKSKVEDLALPLSKMLPKHNNNF
ncbi:MAG: hypothetical protein CM15mP83_7160 [Flavobacteriaceae bacterium]|nr:MAG: hypothetical protein CM15mP83_7160 [Flavobacteriaceae bacterium]